MSEPAPDRQRRWDIFWSWHGQESFWREVYARTFATLTAALVIFLVGVTAGAIDVELAQVLRVAGVLLAAVVVSVGNHLVAKYLFFSTKRRKIDRVSAHTRGTLLIAAMFVMSVVAYYVLRAVGVY